MKTIVKITLKIVTFVFAVAFVESVGVLGLIGFKALSVTKENDRDGGLFLLSLSLFASMLVSVILLKNIFGGKEEK